MHQNSLEVRIGETVDASRFAFAKPTESDGLDRVGDILKPVDCAFYRLDDVFVPQDVHSVEVSAIEVGRRPPEHATALVLLSIYLID